MGVLWARPNTRHTSTSPRRFQCFCIVPHRHPGVSGRSCVESKGTTFSTTVGRAQGLNRKGEGHEVYVSSGVSGWHARNSAARQQLTTGSFQPQRR